MEVCMSYRTVLLSLVLVIPLALSAQTAGSARRMVLQAPDDSPIIVYAEGVVKMDGRIVDIGTRVPDGSTLVTGPDGFAEVVFSQKNILHIGPGSIVSLGLGKLQRSVGLDQGSLGAVLRKLDKLAGGSLEVRTKAGIAAVRGTTFFTEVLPGEPDASYFCSCNGKLELSNADSSQPASLEGAHHHALVFTKTAEGRNEAAGALLDHDDASVEAMAARIGESIDWTRVED
jgi:hypothetical protein